jgi:hypothetical protein
MKSILNYEGLKGKKFAVSNSIRGFEDKHKKSLAYITRYLLPKSGILKVSIRLYGK